TDAGRGRSPRFLARMKALALSDSIPSYDQFLAGDYTNSITNHYVYGYLLIARAYREFGPTVWASITSEAALKVWNPWAIYNAFAKVTGVTFETFYRDTMQELKNSWKGDLQKKSQNVIYSRIDYPIVDNGKLY